MARRRTSVRGLALVAGLLAVGCGDDPTVTAYSTSPSASPPSGLWFQEDWSRYGSTSDLKSHPGFNFPIFANQGGFLELERGVSGTPWGGTAVIRTFWGGGPYGPAGDEQIGIDVFFPDADRDRPRELWFEVYLRFDANWRVGGAGGTGDHKTMFLFESGGNRWEIKFGAIGDAVKGTINNSVTHGEFACLPPVGAKGSCSAAKGGKPDLPQFVWDGEWHRLRWHLKMSSPGAADGVHEAWLDDTKFLESRTVRTASGPDSHYAYVALGRNGDPVEPTNLRWGRVRAWLVEPADWP